MSPPAAVTLRRQWDGGAKGESAPCRISLLNPLLWLAPSQRRKGTKLPRAALAGCAAASRPEVNSLICPRAARSGDRPGEAVLSLSGGVRGSEQASRGWSSHQGRSANRRTDRCPVQVLLPVPQAPQHQALAGAPRERGRWRPSPRHLQPPHGNEGALKDSRTGARGPLTESSAAQRETAVGAIAAHVAHWERPPTLLQFGWDRGQGVNMS